MKAREVGFVLASLMFVAQGLVCYAGVLLGLLPPTPTDGRPAARGLKENLLGRGVGVL